MCFALLHSNHGKYVSFDRTLLRIDKRAVVYRSRPVKYIVFHVFNSNGIVWQNKMG